MFTLTVNTNNAAFTAPDDGDNDEAMVIELQKILDDVAETVGLYPDHDYGPVRDSNGNTVGEWRITR